MDVDYIVVQAGGKGTRMKYLTENKPKALVPVGNLPMIFHLFRKYPDKKFIVIADYKSDVMKKYLEAFAKVQYLVVDTYGKKGTCSGVSVALSKIPSDAPFMLIWSDLILSNEFSMPSVSHDYVGLSNGFRCRWRYQDGIFEEIPSYDTGVAGVFLFQSKKSLQGVPEEGEFVRWMQKKEIHFETFLLPQTKEYGLIEEWEAAKTKENIESRCRPFNKMHVEDDVIIKEGIDEQGRALAVREKAWYQHVLEKELSCVPKIYSYNPFKMERIQGKNIFEYTLSKQEKKEVLKKIVTCLKTLHASEVVPVDVFSIYDAYYKKTIVRLMQIRDLVPFANQEFITVNEKVCRNVFFYLEKLQKRINEYECSEFHLIHGDNTFCNMMLNQNMEPVMIDPRGYFGHTELYGDVAYDWAKLYYSVVGDYDQFNLKRFRLSIGENAVQLKIETNGWCDLKDDFFDLIGDEAKENDIKLIHALIWLSLTTYAWEDYDSICGSFYNGLYYLEDVL